MVEKDVLLRRTNIKKCQNFAVRINQPFLTFFRDPNQITASKSFEDSKQTFLVDKSSVTRGYCIKKLATLEIKASHVIIKTNI